MCALFTSLPHQNIREADERRAIRQIFLSKVQRVGPGVSEMPKSENAG